MSRFYLGDLPLLFFCLSNWPTDLKYALLEYRYSSVARLQAWDTRLFAISMSLPGTFLNSTSAFEPPKAVVEEKDETKGTAPGSSTSFLWQAPSSHAVLFMGQKWTELHGFVSKSLEIQQEAAPVPSLLAEKAVSTQHPAWLEHALRLSRARGYFTHYPSADTASAVAAVHSDLYQPPEEYDAKPLTAAAGGKDAGRDVVMRSGGLLDALPGRGLLAPFSSLPLVTWDGARTTLEELDGRSRQYTLEFRRQVGCADAKRLQNVKVDRLARDLFCE